MEEVYMETKDKKELMEELLQRYQQLNSMSKDNSSYDVVKMYTRKLELDLAEILMRGDK
jgi:hypothetical protein